MYVDRAGYISKASTGDINDANWIRIERASGPKVWRAIIVHHLTGEENGNSHNLYADLLDQDGKLIERPIEKLAFSWNGRKQNETVQPVAFDKSGNEPRANVPIWKGAELEAWIESPYPSDKLFGLITSIHGIAGVDGNSLHHQSYYVVWQLTAEGTISAPDSGDGDAGADTGDGQLPSALVVTLALAAISELEAGIRAVIEDARRKIASL